MPKFNQKGAQSARRSGPATPMTTTGRTTTHEGGNAFIRDAQSELYLLAVTNMVGEDTFYEKAQDRDDRFVRLVRQVAVTDPEWLYRFLGWLRNKANMRSASVVVAAEAIHARLHRPGTLSEFSVLVGDELKTFGNKHFIPQAMARADEPGEFMAYWTSKYGKNIPKPVKRGLAIAVEKLFNEYSYEKYGKSGEWTLADLLDLTHPGHQASWQADLWVHALNERHGRDEPVPESLTMIRRRKQITSTLTQKGAKALLSTDEGRAALREGGMTWEALTGAYGALDATFWESLIFSGQLGYMAMLRNLRNFERAGISREARAAVCTRLAAPGEVERSRQFPYRFLSAYKAVESDWWSLALSDALDHSIGNLPRFEGRTLVLSDTSGSMGGTVSEKSSVTYVEIAALFAVALSRAGAEVDLYGFAGGGTYFTSQWNRNHSSKVCFKHEVPQGGSVLKTVQSFTDRIGEVGHGTELDRAFAEAYSGHDRVVVVSDMQSFGSYAGDITTQCPSDVKLYGLNVAGYQGGVIDLSKRNRYEIGGFSDQVFRVIGLLEAGDGGWPF